MLLLVSISFLLSACKTNALKSCGNVSTLNTDLDYVDVSSLNFGNLLLIDTVNQAVNNWKVLSYIATYIKVQEINASLTNNIKSGLTVTLSGSGASSAIAAGVNASLSNELNFRIVNYKRTDFNDPVSVLKEDANKTIIDECKNPIRKDQIIMLVTSMTNGDTSQIYIGKERAAGLDASSQ